MGPLAIIRRYRRAGSSARPGRIRRAPVPVLAVAGTVLAVAGCGATQFDYVGSNSDKVFFKIPPSWHPLSQGGIAAVQRTAFGLLSPAGRAGGSLVWSMAFDAASQPSASHIFAVTGQPVVYATVQQMNAAQRNRLSFDAMRDLLIPVTPQARAAAARAPSNLSAFVSIGDQVVTPTGGVRGIEEQYQYTVNGTQEVFFQIVLTNSDTTKLYLFLLQCDLTCFARYRDQIATVVGSYTVKGS
jgi:hypothetical protein